MFTETRSEGVCVRVLFVQGASPLGAGHQVRALLTDPTTPTEGEEMLGVIPAGII